MLGTRGFDIPESHEGAAQQKNWVQRRCTQFGDVTELCVAAWRICRYRPAATGAFTGVSQLCRSAFFPVVTAKNSS